MHAYGPPLPQVYLASFEHARSMVMEQAPGARFLTLGRSPLGEGGGDGEIDLHRKLSDPRVRHAGTDA